MTSNEKFFLKFIQFRIPNFRRLPVGKESDVPWRYCVLNECDGCEVVGACGREDFFMPELTHEEYRNMSELFPEYFV